MIHVLAPTFQRATYWCRMWGYSRTEVRIYTPDTPDRLRGLDTRSTELYVIDYYDILDSITDDAEADYFMSVIHRFDKRTYIDTRQDYPT